MITILTEKPSVAAAIANVVNAGTPREGYYYGNGYAVTWANGHLLENFVEGIDGPWKNIPLPIIVDKFDKLRPIHYKGKDGKWYPDRQCVEQLEVIRKLFLQSEYVIEATDAGREGELIFREIYYYIGKGDLPVYRLWLNSLTDEAINNALRNMKPAAKYENLYQSARCRNEADWHIGINATRALSLASGRDFNPLNVGRVQTVMLRMICDRHCENIEFEPQTYWNIVAKAMIKGDKVTAVNNKQYFSNQEAQDSQILTTGKLTVLKVIQETKIIRPPKLHNITSLQREANEQFGYPAEQTTAILQSLYEKKHVSYPRTSSRYVTEDVYKTMLNVVEMIKQTNISNAIPQWPIPGKENRECINPQKVNDHHALVVTDNLPTDIDDEREFNIYCLIMQRMIDNLCEESIYDESKILFGVNGMSYTAESVTYKQTGWLANRKNAKKIDDEHENTLTLKQVLPPLKEGDTLDIYSTELIKRQTEPKPLLTDASLLSMMERADKFTDDEEMKKALKDCDGIGTAATRSDTIKGLIRNGFVIRREDRRLEPTANGIMLYFCTKNKEIASVNLTAKWELLLDRIANGEEDPALFDKAIRTYTADVVKELQNPDFVNMIRKMIGVQAIRCPKCGNPTEINKYKIICQDCHWSQFRIQYGKSLTEAQLRKLFNDGNSGLIKGFKNKAGNTFDATLTYDINEDEIKMEFQNE